MTSGENRLGLSQICPVGALSCVEVAGDLAESQATVLLVVIGGNLLALGWLTARWLVITAGSANSVVSRVFGCGALYSCGTGQCPQTPATTPPPHVRGLSVRTQFRVEG